MESKPLSNYLECKEEIDQRKSPELWPEEIPGAWEVSKANMSCVGDNKPATRFRTDLDPQDVRLVNELGQLNADQLMEYVKNLQNNAFTLGIEEGLAIIIFGTGLVQRCQKWNIGFMECR